jgi:predicted nicotinamide N-methyase
MEVMPSRSFDLVSETVRVAGRELDLLRPRDGEALIDEHAFEHEEYLPYWAELWPSALALAGALGLAPPAPGTRVLELGCGLAVPSIVAALGGADVVATDWSPEAVSTATQNARRNGAELTVRRWSWTAPAIELGEPWPLVVAADVLYERRNVPQLLAALPTLVAPGGEAWIADPGRTPAPGFLEAAGREWAIDAVAHDGPAFVTVHRLRRR